MTPLDVMARLADVYESRHDPEVAHGKEDHLHQDVLRAIADGADYPTALAALALQTLGMDFARWTA